MTIDQALEWAAMGVLMAIFVIMLGEICAGRRKK